MFHQKPYISVVFGTFQQVDILKKVLAEFECQTLAPDEFEVVVVDSSSSDGTQEFLNSYRPAYCFLPIIQKNLGKASARNRAIQEAKGDIILITDADMIPHPDLVKTHLEAHQKSKNRSCYEGVTLNMTALHWPPETKKLYPYIQRTYSEGARLGWYYFLTGNVSLPKSLFQDLEGFDPDFTGYGWEDLELGYRLSQKKYPLYYLKPAINYHYHVVTQEEEISRCKKKGESAKILLSKHPELKLFLGLNPLSIWIFPKISFQGPFYRWVLESCFNSKNSLKKKFGFWFLKEYHYLSGLLK